MKVVCSWCGKEMGEKDGKGVEGVSHGICDSCFEELKKREERGLAPRSKQFSGRTRRMKQSNCEKH